MVLLSTGMPMKNLLLAVSFSLLTSTAFAADAIVEEAAVGVVPGFTWIGYCSSLPEVWRLPT